MIDCRHPVIKRCDSPISNHISNLVLPVALQTNSSRRRSNPSCCPGPSGGVSSGEDALLHPKHVCTYTRTCILSEHAHTFTRTRHMRLHLHHMQPRALKGGALLHQKPTRAHTCTITHTRTHTHKHTHTHARARIHVAFPARAQAHT